MSKIKKNAPWLGLMLAPALMAQTAPSTVTLEDIQKQKRSRIPASLTRIYAESASRIAQAVPTLPLQSNRDVYQIKDGYVLIDASSDNPKRLKTKLVALGLRNAQRFGPVVSGWFPIDKIPRLENLSLIRVLRPIPKPLRRQIPVHVQAVTDETPAGEVGNQGDLSMATDLLRSQYGVDGSGVMVGVISDSYDATNGAATDVAQGRLPNGVIVLSDEVPDGTDEGRAMMQLIHKIAPGAQLAFESESAGGEVQLALRVLALAGCPDTLPAEIIEDCELTPGVAAQVIVDDLSLSSEPFFQIGLWSQAVNAVQQAGVTYLSSAGNDGDSSYQAWYRSSGLPGFSGGQLHDFDPGPAVDVYQKFYAPVGQEISFKFQWSDPVASQCLEPCGGSASDFDIEVVGDGEGKSILLAGSFEANIGGDPVEFLTVKNTGNIDVDGVPGPDEYFNLMIEHAGGPPLRLLKCIVHPRARILEYRTNSSTVYGHESAEGGMSIGAVNWPDSPYFGQYPARATDYSSLGGTPILFDANGQPMYNVPQQPWLLAPDAVQVWVAGSKIFQGPFSGTSAAAPSAAAAAALLLSYQPSLSPDAIKQALMNTAVPWNFNLNYNFKDGYGWIDPLGAANHLFVQPNQIIADIVANGKREFLSAGAALVEISAQFNIGQNFLGSSVDLFLAAEVDGHWYSLVGPDGAQKWVYSGVNLFGLTPYQSGVMLSTPRVLWPNILRIQQTLPANYHIYVGMDTVPNGQLDYDSFHYQGVTVEMGLPLSQ